MRALLLLVVVSFLLAVASGLPRNPRQELRLGEDSGAEVIRVSNDKTPILLTSDNAAQDAENVIALDAAVDAAAAANSTSPQPPTPVPESVPITTEKLEQSTPSLVPSVVDISTQNPANTPPPPANATAPGAPPAEEDEESDEDSEEEADEEEEEEEEDDDDEEDEEEEDEEADDEEEEDDEEAKAAKKLIKQKNKSKSKSKREVAAGEEVVHSFNESAVGQQNSNEDEEDVGAGSGGKKRIVGEGEVSGLQGVVAAGATNEDDEGESILISSKVQPATVVIT